MITEDAGELPILLQVVQQIEGSEISQVNNIIGTLDSIYQLEWQLIKTPGMRIRNDNNSFSLAVISRGGFVHLLFCHNKRY